MSIGDETYAGINEVQSYLSGNLSGRNVPSTKITTATHKPVVTTINSAIMKGRLTSTLPKTRTYEKKRSNHTNRYQVGQGKQGGVRINLQKGTNANA